MYLSGAGGQRQCTVIRVKINPVEPWPLTLPCMSIGCGELRSGVESGTEPRSSANRGESADHPRRPGHRLITVVCHLPVHPRSNCKERGTSDRQLWRPSVSQLRGQSRRFCYSFWQVEFPPDLCSRVTFVNFTVTRSSLQSQCLNEVLKAERPDVDEKRSDLLKLQGVFLGLLRESGSRLGVNLEGPGTCQVYSDTRESVPSGRA